MRRLNLHAEVTRIYWCKLRENGGNGMQFVMSNIIGQYFDYFVHMFAYLNALNLKNVLFAYSTSPIWRRHAIMITLFKPTVDE